jgi:hypothetical protein
MQPPPLPTELADAPFSTSMAREHGLGPGRLRRSDLVHPTRGAHARSVPADLVEKAGAFAVGLPAERAFSHLTAAALLGLPLPSGLEGIARNGPLHVMSPTADGQTRRAGCTGHRGLESRQTSTVHGVRVVEAADTWCDLGELGRRLSVDDLVVLGDAVVAKVSSGVADAQWMLRRPLEARV